MEVNEQQIKNIVERVVKRLEQADNPARPQVEPKPAKQIEKPATQPSPGSQLGLFPTVDQALKAAWEAHRTLDSQPLALREKIIAAMRCAVRQNAESLAKFCVEETGLGRVEDKVKKNLLAADKTPGVEILQPICYTGDRGMTLIERAPYGVIGAITPVTNPIATIVSNAIGMIAGGNAVLFNPHPSAKRTSHRIVHILNEAIISAGGPPNLLCCISEPTIQSAQELMKHPGFRLLVVTGGPAVVRLAMNSGKKVIAAGPGNPPVVVDETADIPRAARDIVIGASFDNNMVCILEKEIIAVDSIADELKAQMKKHGAYELNEWQTKRLVKLVIAEDRGPGKEGVINKQFVGKNAAYILDQIGIEAKDDIRLILSEVDREHVLFWTEQLMPVMPLVRVKNVDEAIELAKAVEQGNYHTAVMHSRNIESLSKMARTMNTSLFVKNGPSVAGLGANGEGYTSFTIASPTGEGLTTARNFTREHRCTLVDAFRIV